MNKKWSRMALGAMATLIAFALVSLLVWDLPGASAQDVSDPWLSSAEPPEGISIEALSPPDQPGLDNNRLDNEPEERAVIRYHRITGSALRPRDSIVDFNIDANGSCIYAVNNAFDIFNIPLWLPQGAVVERLRMYYSDTSASNSSAWFTVYDLYGDIVEEWAVSSSGDFGNSFNDTDPITHEIDYSNYSYMINWRPVASGTTMQLCGFRIFFEPPPFYVQFLPSVIN